MIPRKHADAVCSVFLRELRNFEEEGAALARTMSILMELFGYDTRGAHKVVGRAAPASDAPREASGDAWDDDD